MFKKNLFLSILFVLSAFMVSVSASANSLEDIFADANKSFENGKYKEAADYYKQLENFGVKTEELFFNMAVTQCRLGNLGRAVQYYEKVLAISPSNDDAIYNLKVVRNFIAQKANEQGRNADLAPAIGPWRAILDRFSPNAAAIAFLFFYLLFFAVLIARRFIKGELLRLGFGVAIGILGILAVVTGAVTAGKWYQATHVQEAVVISSAPVSVLEGPKSKVTRFTLEEGSRVEILEHRDKWLKIQDDHGRDGWVNSSSLGKI
jgi:tetratricopeptide (TPR) repeat protein